MPYLKMYLSIRDLSQNFSASTYKTRIYSTIYASVKRAFVIDSYESAADRMSL